VTRHLITKEEAEVLRNALVERGELQFPVSYLVQGFLCGTVFAAQKRPKSYKPKLSTRLIARFSDGYASVLAFILWLGPENVMVWSYPHDKGKWFKFYFHVRLQPNYSFKCAPSGPDAAALRRLI